MRARLRPTWRHPGAAAYGRPGGPWDVPTLDTMMCAVSRRADRVVDGDLRLGKADLERRVDALAGGLRIRGVRRHDVVSWQLPNGHESVLLYRACWRLGAVAAAVHHAAGPSDAASALAQVQPRLVVDRDGVAALLEEGERVPVPANESVPVASDLATVLFTSGSTGAPKAVLHTHRGLAYVARVMTAAHGLRPSDVVLMPAPLAHISGLQNGVLLPGATGMKCVLMARWDPEAALETIERERVTFMIGPPTFFVSLMDAPGFATGRTASLRLISCGGAGVTPSFVQEAAAALGCRIKRTYGSTEAPTVTTSWRGDPVSRTRETDGRPVGQAELRVSDPVDGRALPDGQPGELWLRGPGLFVGYADAQATRASVDRGWFRTGDLATVDSDGWLTIVGRLKDVIIRGGENVSTAEVEAVLEAHPAVRHAVAVGYPDHRLGERVAAFVVATEPFDLAACRAWFEARGVTRFKTPERVVQVAELPLLAAGKPDRAALRASLAAGF